MASPGANNGASTNGRASASASASASANTSATPDHITLRIIILAHGNRAEDDLFLVLHLDTTIAQLKARIQESLSQHPPADVQRLIYHGRPLLDAREPLRHILRVQVDPRAGAGAGAGSPSHVLHLVIRDTPTTTATTQPAARPAQPAIVPQPIPQSIPQQIHQPAHPQPLHTHIHLPQGLPPDAHAQIHHRLHNMQHQLAHAQAIRANQARMNPQQPVQNHARGPSAPPPPLPHTTFPVPVPNQIGQPQPMPGTGNGTMRIEERIGPNGEQIRTVVDQNGNSASSATLSFRIAAVNAPNPLDRPSSAPGSSPVATNDTPNPHRSTPAAPQNIQIHPPLPVPHQPTPLSVPPALQLPPSSFMPAFIPHLMHQPLQVILQPPSSQTMAWLVSSPQGPYGLVFAPGHGLFTTLSPTSTSNQPQTSLSRPTPTPTTTVPHPQPQADPPQPQAQLVVRPHDGHAEIRRPGAPAAPQPAARPQPPRPLIPHPPHPPARLYRPAQQNQLGNNEVVQFIINRGWLFLRLYMFVFILSESGTWRRIIMLGIAIIFALLPQRNPVIDALQAARHHFDNLIGPPQIPDRPAQQQQQQQQGQRQQIPQQGQPTQHGNPSSPTRNGNTTTTRSSSAPMPTPEEAARRLLDRQRGRNPNPAIDLLYRIEQGVVLFLASLVPGLGERHVRAREQARRILREEETRTREERERQQQLANAAAPSTDDSSGENGSRNKDAGPLPDSWATSATTEGSSSGIDRSTSDQPGIRSRASQE